MEDTWQTLYMKQDRIRLLSRRAPLEYSISNDNVADCYYIFSCFTTIKHSATITIKLKLFSKENTQEVLLAKEFVLDKTIERIHFEFFNSYQQTIELKVEFKCSNKFRHIPIEYKLVKSTLGLISAYDINEKYSFRLCRHLDLGGDPNIIPSFVGSQLYQMKLRAPLDHEKYLLTWRIFVEFLKQQGNATLLHCAAYLPLESGDYESIKLLLERGANKAALTSNTNRTPMDLAILSGKPQNVLDLLLLPYQPRILRNPNQNQHILGIVIERNTEYSVICPYTAEGGFSVFFGEKVITKQVEDDGWVQCQKSGPLIRTLGYLPAWVLGPVNMVNEFSRTNLITGEETQYRVIHDFNSAGPGEISIKKGEIVIGLGSAGEDGWIRVRISKPTDSTLTNIVVKGYVPFSHLRKNDEIHIDTLPSNKTEETASEDRAECPICFDEMHLAPVAVFCDNREKRTCRHFIHYDCVQNLVTSGGRQNCPVCRNHFDMFLKVPDFEIDSKRWMKIMDFSGDGQLNKMEVMDACKALLPIDYRALEQNVDSFWSDWTDNKDEITEIDLTKKDGLLTFIRKQFGKSASEVEVFPTLDRTGKSKMKWFCYWDENKNGLLTKDQVTRALVKTYGLSVDQAKMTQLKLQIQEIWPVFCKDPNACNLLTFMEPNGLGDAFCASFQSISSVIQPSPNSANSMWGREVIRSVLE